MSEQVISDIECWDLSYPETHTYRAEADEVSRASNGAFLHPAIEQFRRLKEDGLLLEEGLFSRLTEDENFLVESVTFQEIDEWAEGRRESKHGVQFGKLSFTRTDGQVSEIDVAIKPFLQSRSKASNELAATLKLPEVTAIQGFETIGAINSNGKLAIITRFEHQVTSLDNLDWNLGLNATLNDSVNVISALRLSALTLARMHQAGMTHNDSQIKNMAVLESVVETASYELRLIDLEQARWRDTHDIQDRRSYLDEVRGDISGIVGSILARGLWRNPNLGNKTRAVQTLFTDVYLSYLRHPANKTEIYDEELHHEVNDKVASVLDQI